MLAWILILLVLGGAAVYIALTPRDVDPDFVEHQASVSATRQPGESPVARSLANPHGHQLMGEARPLSRFQFTDVWADAATFRIQYVTQQGAVRSLRHLAPLVAKVQRAIADYPPQARLGLRFDVGVEALVAFFAVALSGRVPVLVDEDADEAEDSGEAPGADEAENGGAARVPVVLHRAEFRFAMESSGITVEQPGGGSVVVSLQDVGASDAELAGAAAAGPRGPDQPVLVHAGLGPRAEATVSERALGVAIAGQLTALGSQNRWSSRDTVFMAPGPLSIYSFVAMLTALSAKAPLVFAETGPLLPATKALLLTRPTVVVSDDETMRTLVKHVDEFTAVKWLHYGWRRLRLARGALTRPPMIAEFRTVRLLHSASGADPYKWLSNADVAGLRVLTGSQVVHTFTPEHGLPVAQTSVGDYRAGAKAGVNWGPPLPGLELKRLVDQDRLALRRADHPDWATLPAETTEHATLLRDGCLYVPEKRHDFSDYYYYTGELQ